MKSTVLGMFFLLLNMVPAYAEQLNSFNLIIKDYSSKNYKIGFKPTVECKIKERIFYQRSGTTEDIVTPCGRKELPIILVKDGIAKVPSLRRSKALKYHTYYFMPVLVHTDGALHNLSREPLAITPNRLNGDSEIQFQNSDISLYRIPSVTVNYNYEHGWVLAMKYTFIPYGYDNLSDDKLNELGFAHASLYDDVVKGTLPEIILVREGDHGDNPRLMYRLGFSHAWHNMWVSYKATVRYKDLEQSLEKARAAAEIPVSQN